jgi:hypothetical protein
MNDKLANHIQIALFDPEHSGPIQAETQAVWTEIVAKMGVINLDRVFSVIRYYYKNIHQEDIGRHRLDMKDPKLGMRHVIPQVEEELVGFINNPRYSCAEQNNAKIIYNDILKTNQVTLKQVSAIITFHMSCLTFYSEHFLRTLCEEEDPHWKDYTASDDHPPPHGYYGNAWEKANGDDDDEEIKKIEDDDRGITNVSRIVTKYNERNDYDYSAMFAEICDELKKNTKMTSEDIRNVPEFIRPNVLRKYNELKQGATVVVPDDDVVVLFGKEGATVKLSPPKLTKEWVRSVMSETYKKIYLRAIEEIEKHGDITAVDLAILPKNVRTKVSEAWEKRH